MRMFPDQANSDSDDQTEGQPQVPEEPPPIPEPSDGELSERELRRDNLRHK